MKQIVNCLQEFAGLHEDKRPTYMIKSGNLLIANTSTFPLIPNSGNDILKMGNNLLNFLAAKDTSKVAMKQYEDFLADCIAAMEANYIAIDLVALGDGAIVALGCVNGSSVNTSSTGNPSTPENVKYVFVDDVGEIIITQDVDKIAYGRVIISYTNPLTTVVKSGNSQLKVTTPDGSITFVDVDTKNSTVIQNQTEGNRINSVVANFNPNGISPVASPKSVIIPR